jgi:hypothetical protein
MAQVLVTQCQDCKHWRQENRESFERDRTARGFGWCTIIKEELWITPDTKAFTSESSYESSYLYTHSTFGCTLGEPKP